MKNQDKSINTHCMNFGEGFKHILCSNTPPPSQPKRKRQEKYVNIAKGIAICAVVMMHINYNDIGGFLPTKMLFGYSWHVAVFFLIGGFFIKIDDVTKPQNFIKKKMKTLYKMCLCYYLPAVILHNTLFKIGWYSSEISYGGKIIFVQSFADTVKNVVMAVLFAGREPILGAMWFVYVLLLALIGYSLLSYIVKRFTPDSDDYEKWRTIALLILCIVSCTMSQKLDFMIPRFSNTITAMWLLHLGFLLKNVVRLKFDNKYLAFASLLIVYHLTINVGGMDLNRNDYRDVGYLSLISVSALYSICYFSKKIENSLAGSFLDKCGKESFHIMALQFVGFKCCALFLAMLGINANVALLCPYAGNCNEWLLIYFLFGLLIPILFISFFRKIKSLIIR